MKIAMFCKKIGASPSPSKGGEQKRMFFIKNRCILSIIRELLTEIATFCK